MTQAPTRAGDWDSASALLRSLREVNLENFTVVGNCLRFDENSRNSLKDFRQRLAEGFFSRNPAPNNFLLWGLPGSGKSYVVQQAARSLPSDVRFEELNLTQLDSAEFRTRLEAFASVPAPGVCFIDEADAKPDQAWPYETLLPFLEPSTPRSHATAFCLAASGGGDLSDLREQIRARPKGKDLLSRVPAGNEFSVSTLGVGDKILVGIVQLILGAREEGHAVHEIEKFALYYLAVNPTFSSARQLRSRAVQCALRIPPSEDRIRYDFLFRAGDPENKQFWNDAGAMRDGLVDSFVRVNLGQQFSTAEATSPRVAERRREPLPAESGMPRIAVLPFANISPDQRDSYFADGLTEELISVVSQIKGLRVISHTSVHQYKGTTKSIAQIGSELGVGSVIEGSVRKAGDQVRIAVQLIDAQTDEHRWADTYDRRLENIFAIQADVAKRTAEALKVELLKPESEALQRKPTSSLPAYESYLRGLQASQRFASSSYVEWDLEVAGHLQEAIRLDPEFAGAHAALATHLIAVSGMTRPVQDVIPRARELVTRAFSLNPNLSDAHVAMGNLAMQADYDWERAESEFRSGIALNPSSSIAHGWYAYLLGVLQRFDDAMRENRAAIELDPLSLLPRMQLIHNYEAVGDYENTLAECKKVTQSFPDSRDGPNVTAWTYAFSGRREEALRLVEPLRGAKDAPTRAVRAFTLAYLGDTGELQELITEVDRGIITEFVRGAALACALALCRENERAISTLEQEFEAGVSGLWNIYQNRELDAIRSDPRFVAMLLKLNLPTTLTRPLWNRPGLDSRQGGP